MMLTLNNQKIFTHLFKIQWNNYWKDILNLFSGTILIVITLSIWMLIRSENGFLYDNYILGSCVGVVTVRTGMNNLSKNITNVNQIIKLESINSFRQRLQVYLSLFLFNHTINLINVAAVVGYATLFSRSIYIISNINWGMVIYAYFLILFTANLFALCLNLIFKNPELNEALMEFHYFTGVYLLGLVIPFYLIADHKLTLIASYFIFYRYSINIICAGWMNSKNFIIVNQDGSAVDLGYHENAWIPYVVSLLLVLVLGIIILSIIYIKHTKTKKRQLRRIMHRSKKYLQAKFKTMENKEELKKYLRAQEDQLNEK
ncbi:ABC transporter permease [Spiroplasma clarkii]|uniref:ABC transporter permease n=2 Tax=Spiroplasma clarkii TaxID=2139 RepID=A0A2K8KIP5_9MOLU|nr:ABC transporter permease [Spiroplasma clarkii]